VRFSKEPLLVGIVGGSGSGKTWLAERLKAELGWKAALISLDDFYRDRSYLSTTQRERVNYDHPRAIEWPLVEKTLNACRKGKTARVPAYDFSCHSRFSKKNVFQPRPIILLDGLWLFRQRNLRRLFKLRIYVDCPVRLRLKRRLARDMLLRKRLRKCELQRFWKQVEPMNAQYVVPQKRWAHIVLKSPIRERDLCPIIGQLTLLEDGRYKQSND